MGRPGAYLRVSRQEHGSRRAPDSTRDYAEIALPLNPDEQRAQASRCMYCGVAFCQAGVSFGNARPSGCPLHNLIPEWNDLVWRGLWNEAYERLSLTNPFPEFTGRVCPALCEAACNLGLHDGPTTIRDNERAISDHAWAAGGGPVPLARPGEDAPAVTVVGSGPAGLACSWELARRGMRVTLVERADRAGGLLMYGIPNMKLPKDVVERRVELMRSSGIELRCGVDAGDADVAAAILGASDAVVVATGARKARRLSVPGADLDGVVLAVDYLTGATKALLGDGVPPVDDSPLADEAPLADGDTRTSSHAQSLPANDAPLADGATRPSSPAQALRADGPCPVSASGLDVVVIGGGDTGTDCVATALRQGAASVTQLEFMPEPPAARREDNAWPEWPNVRKDDYGQLEAAATFGCDPRQWGIDTLEVLGKDGQVCGLRVASLDWSSGKPERIGGSERTIDAQLVLIAMGFVGPERSVFEALGVSCDDDARGLPQVVAQSHRAQANHEVPVFVAGDCHSGSSLVVSAIADGLSCASEVADMLNS